MDSYLCHLIGLEKMILINKRGRGFVRLVKFLLKGHKIPKDTFVSGDIHYVMARDPLFIEPGRYHFFELFGIISTLRIWQLVLARTGRKKLKC